MIRTNGLSFACTACDRWDQHDLIAILEGVRIAAKKANVLVIHIDVDEAPQLARFILDLRR